MSKVADRNRGERSARGGSKGGKLSKENNWEANFDQEEKLRH